MFSSPTLFTDVCTLLFFNQFFGNHTWCVLMCSFTGNVYVSLQCSRGLHTGNIFFWVENSLCLEQKNKIGNEFEKYEYWVVRFRCNAGTVANDNFIVCTNYDGFSRNTFIFVYSFFSKLHVRYLTILSARSQKSQRHTLRKTIDSRACAFSKRWNYHR